MLNWFESGGADYARYRPQYPAALLDYLLSLTPAHHHALDVGCGTGQLTGLLASAFTKVTAIDPSQTQIDNAEPHARIEYRVGPAEQLPPTLHDINLITVAQAPTGLIYRLFTVKRSGLRPRAPLSRLSATACSSLTRPFGRVFASSITTKSVCTGPRKGNWWTMGMRESPSRLRKYPCRKWRFVCSGISRH